MLRIKTLGWWYWCIAAGLIAASLYWPAAFPFAVAFCVFQAAHFLVREGSPRAFPVQLRVAYLGMLLLGAWPPFWLTHWVQLVGTLVFVSVNYCLLSRILVLMPWNRRAPASAGVVVRTIFSRPMPGDVLLAMAQAPRAEPVTG